MGGEGSSREMAHVARSPTTTSTSQTYFWLVVEENVNSSNTVAVPQINGFSDSGEVFKIKDNERDYT